MQMSKENELLDKVILFLILLVGSILIISQYQFFKISQSRWNYASIALAMALIGLVAWLFLAKGRLGQSSVGGHSEEHHEHTEKRHEAIKEAKPLTFMEKISYAMTALIAILIVFNQMQISQASALAGFKGGLTLKSASAKTTLALTGDPLQDAMTIVVPRGAPFYGEVLGVSFEDPIRSLEIIAQLDPAYGRNKVQLSQEEKARYIRVLTTPTITCEFCCGAKTAVTPDGRPACGCKHVWAMRGLAAYLIKNYPQLSDDEIKKELMHWKGLFFPKQMIQRYVEETQTGQYTPDIAALLLDVDEKKLKEMKEAVASQGSAQSSNGAAASINDLPSMVGGC